MSSRAPLMQSAFKGLGGWGLWRCSFRRALAFNGLVALEAKQTSSTITVA